MGWSSMQWCQLKGYITVSTIDPTICLELAVQEPYVLISPDSLLLCGKNLFGMNMKGTLSDDMGSLTELRVLDLSSNRDLGGPLNPAIGKLIQLINLALIGCSFSGNVPSELGNLAQLEFLIWRCLMRSGVPVATRATRRHKQPPWEDRGRSAIVYLGISYSPSSRPSRSTDIDLDRQRTSQPQPC